MSKHISRVAGGSVAALFVSVALIAAPGAAIARPDPGPPVPQPWTSGSCALERVGTQLVRCDDLTGNGVAAPSHLRSR
jgi:hypothetical protein